MPHAAPRPSRPAGLLAASAAAVLACTAESQSLRSLGAPPNAAWTNATGISADGSVVVGYMNAASGPDRAFRWTAAGGMQVLPVLAGTFGGQARAVSGDGSLVVGDHLATTPPSAFNRKAAGWNQQGVLDLGAVIAGTGSSSVYDASHDGSVLVGTLGPRAFRWSQATGVLQLPPLQGSTFGHAAAVSADGEVVVGWSSGGTQPQARPFRWDAESGTQPLALPSGTQRAYASGISADGQFIVGNVVIGDRRLPVRWNAAGQVEQIELAAGWLAAECLASNADGSVIAGNGFTEDGARAFVWTACGGMVSVEQRLSEQGVNLEGWTGLLEAHGLDATGRFVVGHGTLNGSTRPFLADLGPGVGRSPDLDHDGAVDGVDLGLMLAGRGGTGAADLDGSGAVDGTDLGLLLASWGACGK